MLSDNYCSPIIAHFKKSRQMFFFSQIIGLVLDYNEILDHGPRSYFQYAEVFKSTFNVTL